MRGSKIVPSVIRRAQVDGSTIGVSRPGSASTAIRSVWLRLA